MTDGMTIGIYDENTFLQTDSWVVKTNDGHPEN